MLSELLRNQRERSKPAPPQPAEEEEEGEDYPDDEPMTEKLAEPEKPDSRNTNNKGNQRQCRAWFFTWNSYSNSNLDEFIMWLDDQKNTRYAMQEETGRSGNKHIQGVLYFKNKVSFNYLKHQWEQIHWEQCRNLMAAKQYCLKLNTRSGKQFVKGFKMPPPRRTLDVLTIHEPYPWQKCVIRELSKPPNDRTIEWLWEEDGNTGKTALCIHICMKYKDAIYVAGKSQDIFYGILQKILGGTAPRILLIDIPRSCQKYLSYQALEKVKDGIFFSGKYESNMVLYDPPHVYCFANFHPEKEWLSKDRWHIRKIKHKN